MLAVIMLRNNVFYPNLSIAARHCVQKAPISKRYELICTCVFITREMDMSCRLAMGAASEADRAEAPTRSALLFSCRGDFINEVAQL